MGKPKQFCPRGHDTFKCGRTYSHCIQCLREKHPLKRGGQIEHICVNGHDKNVVGKYPDGHCKKCHSQYKMKRLKFNVIEKLKTRLRVRISKLIKRKNRVGSAVKDLGCSIEFFKDYISSKFYDGMTWENYGDFWELDHIKELHTFDLTDPEQFKKAVHYTNFQPLTIPDHLKKTMRGTKKRIRKFPRQRPT